MSFSFVKEHLAQQKRQHRLRKCTAIEGVSGSNIVVAGKAYLNFSSNDYLGLNNHPQIIKALAEGAEKYGVSSSASSLVTGYNFAHQALEDTIASWLNKEKVLLFTSGFSANHALMQALGKKESLLLLDKLSHASIIDGALASEATTKRYLHNNYQQLEDLCLRNSDKNILIATESVFSMDGDETDTQRIAEIAKQYKACSYVDEAHSFGIKGDLGQGSSAADIDIVMATFGKAVATSGAFVACNNEIYDYLINFARHYIYSTAMSPAIAWATRKSIELIQCEHWRRENLTHLEHLFKSELDNSINLLPTTSPIHAINVNDEAKALAASKKLREKGIWVTAIRPPTVPNGTSRLRVTICANHNESNIKYLAESLNEVLV
ncbi:8-amino-7-oxononanoate synthase [Thalassotalea sp. M1531]|uniref:8-amino-7-oxononanoate synthase n=1 Tax=Thalassotalea algicola TaxID=2716224 RepID=A0A7Y0LDX4_9GAMM|nr:8-amino-7-oxononanoate synthase [Thalassotalea algicola]NMP32367.1 8-amino-7-oxononanoate synthase [Thalassotalea algicola]